MSNSLPKSDSIPLQVVMDARGASLGTSRPPLGDGGVRLTDGSRDRGVGIWAGWSYRVTSLSQGDMVGVGWMTCR